MTKGTNVQFERIKDNFLVRRWTVTESFGCIKASNGLGDVYSITVNHEVWTYQWAESNLNETEERFVCLSFKGGVCCYFLGRNAHRHLGKTLEQVTDCFLADLMQFRLIGRERETLLF